MTALSATNYNGYSYAAATQASKSAAQALRNESSTLNNSAADPQPQDEYLPGGESDSGTYKPKPLSATDRMQSFALDEEGNFAGYTKSINDVSYESATEKERELMKKGAKLNALVRWQKEHDYNFFETPKTAEEKKLYNEMAVQARKDGIEYGFRMYGSLNKIEGTDWMIADGAEALIGHEVLHWAEGQATVESAYNEHGPVDQRVNEYGFAMEMPAAYKDVSYLTTEFDRGDGTTIKVPILGLDGGQTYTPEITFSDALGLDGMSLDDRKLFLDTAQKILDKVMPGMDARQLKYTTGTLDAEDIANDTFSLKLDDVAWLSGEQRDTIEQALNRNNVLLDMKQAADASGNKGLGTFTMSVLDEQGRVLTKDHIRLIAGGNSIVTNVNTIKDLDFAQVYDLVMKGVRTD